MDDRSQVEDSADPSAAAAAPKRGRLALIAVVLFLFGGGAGWGASWFLAPRGGGDDAAAEGEGEEKGGEAGGHGGGAEGGQGEEGAEGAVQADAAVADGTIFSLGEQSVNLRGSGGGRMLRIEVQVEGTATAVKLCEDRQSQIRDAIITLASDYTWAELEGSNGKMRLHDEFLVRINAILSPERVERVYFTQFVVH